MLLDDKASFEGGGNSFKRRNEEMLDWMLSGRWTVFDHLEDWFAEFRLYPRKGGLVVKLKDDQISALRYAMMKRYAVTAPRARSEMHHYGSGTVRGASAGRCWTTEQSKRLAI